MAILWLGAAVFLLPAVAFTYLLRQLLARPNLPEFESGWLDRFSMRKYAPMERLLDDRDLTFAGALAGPGQGIAGKLQRDRQRIRRAYLRSLRRDFNRLCLAGRVIALYSSEDRPELTKELLRLQISFNIAFQLARIQVVFGSLGFGSVDLTRVVRPLAILHAQLTPTAATV
ncbi:MAG: hypothetical protein IT160_08235 [Bryobacterales bacterium]|nr:hypothetical protein [Bryobacterales bacterium]